MTAVGGEGGGNANRQNHIQKITPHTVNDVHTGMLPGAALLRQSVGLLNGLSLRTCDVLE